MSAILTRLLQAVIALLVLGAFTFVLTRLSGDPVLLLAAPDASEEDLMRIRERLGLARPLWEQFLAYMGGLLTIDLGNSIKYQVPAASIVLERVPSTLALAAAAMAVGIALAIPAGIVAAVFRNSWIDSAARSLALIGQSMPTFWIGILLILIFAVAWPVLPAGGSGTGAHLVLPALALGLYVSAAMLRVTRSAMIEALGNDYIRTARSKGLSDRATVLGHALPNAATPILGITLLEAATVLRGAVVTETVFAWPGVGKLAVDAVYARDFPVVLAAVLFMGTVFLALSLLADLLQARIDPRVRNVA